ncbi:MAG: CAP domain-containing protein [Candidatus Levyibacteriota bacterium]
MQFFEPLITLRQLILSVPLNFFDIILIISCIFYVYEEASVGILPALTNLVSILVSFIGGLFLYHSLSAGLFTVSGLSKGISDATSFLAIAAVLFLISTNVIAYLTRKHSFFFPNRYSKLGGAVCGVISFSLISAFVVSLLLSLPVSLVIKSQIRNSLAGQFLFTKTQTTEVYTREIFGGAIEDTLNFLTVKPNSDTTVTLHFKTNSGTVDVTSEKKMLQLINSERKKRGIEALTVSSFLTQVARNHAQDMLERGYFSHYTPEGLSPFDRLEKLSIPYGTAAENLAFAPDVDLAVTGLMKSEEHKKNILNPSFHNIGIGVIDAGIYGKMFVQEFTD